jgi:hypothetical protein
MPSKHTRANSQKLKAPYIKKLKQRGRLSIWIVDGAYVRTNKDEEWDNYGHHYTFKFIPRDEIWLDQQADPDEQKFYVTHCLVERRLMMQGKDEDTARKEANKAERAARRRAGDVKKLTQGHELPDPEKVHVRLWKKLENDVSVWIVNGRLVRSVFDIDFTQGGHEHVYEFIPRNELWIDDDVTDAERAYVLLHELHERNIMEKGTDYERAHAESSKLELYHRKHPDKLHEALANEGWE